MEIFYSSENFAHFGVNQITELTNAIYINFKHRCYKKSK